MYRIDDPTGSANENGTGKAGYTEGSPGVTLPSRVRAAHLNAFQEELCRTIESAGVTLAKASNDQLGLALEQMATFAQARIAIANVARKQATTDTIQAFARDVVSNMIAVGNVGGIWMPGANETWTKQTQAASFTGSFLGAASANPGSWLAVGSSGEIQHSTNRTTWTHQNAASSYTGSFNAAAGAAVADALTAKYCAVGSAGEIQKSNDGLTWVRAKTGGDAFKDVVKNSAGTAYIACTDNAIWKSTDVAAATWVQVASLGGQTLARVKQTIACRSTDKIHLSVDDGVTWTTNAGNGPGRSGGYLYGIECSPDPIGLQGNLWTMAYTTSSSEIFIARRPDAVNWYRIPSENTQLTISPAKSIAALGRVFYADGAGIASSLYLGF
jgi:hypothetical protein